jgi:CRISPR-associated protein Cas6
MYWQDDNPSQAPRVPDDVVDVAYAISCARLPIDHAYALSRALRAVFPWFADETGAALHTIHVAASGNGWIRPTDYIHPSKRTKLVIRLPKPRLSEAPALSGRTLDIDGHSLRVGAHGIRPLNPISTVFARDVAAGAEPEEAFLANALQQLRALDIAPKKMLCGIQGRIATPDGVIQTRSLMLAELSFDESLRLQQRGLGAHRALGCGVFIPHKDIQELK